MKRLIILVSLGLMLGLPAAAQNATEALERGKAAFREGRYADAVQAFERATQQDPDNAEAYFLLARVYFETPLDEARKAGRAIDKAIELDPDNVQYLVARLEQLRTDSWNFFAERIKEAKRVEIARDILKLDSTNAFAHEELGVASIHDFWRYRNAIMLPTLQFGQGRFNRNELMPATATAELGLGADDPNVVITSNAGVTTDPLGVTPFDPNDVFMTDRFDVDALLEQGVPVQDLSARAERAYDRAIDHLRMALQSDPRRRSVYDQMMRIFALKGEYEDALEMLETMYAHFSEESELWMYLGLAHYRMGNLDAAHRSFETGLRFASPEVAEAYNSLDDLLAPEEKARYDQDPIAYASRFWTSKDPRFLTPYNERRLEHFARLTYADLLYGSEDLNLRGWDTQRGRILVRYGMPRSDVVIVPSTMSETARRALAGALSATQSGGFDSDAQPLDELQVNNNPDAVNALLSSSTAMFDAMNTFNIWDYGAFRFVFEDPFRNGEYRLYSPSAEEIASGVDAWVNDYEIRARETFRDVPERYEYEAPGRQIELPYLVTSFRGEGGLTDSYVHYGVPIAEYDPSAEQLDVTANTGTFLISEDRDILVEQRRTIYGLRTSQIIPFEETNLWTDTKLLHAPPGTHQLSVEFETASGGTVAVQRREVTIPNFGEANLALSDVMLAYAIEETPDGKPLGDADVVRRGLSITPAPWSVFSHERPIYLYVEVYDLELGGDGRTDYQVEITLTPKDTRKGVGKLVSNIFGGRDRGVSVAYPGSGTNPNPEEYQILDATDQEPGLYTLRIQVRDNLGRGTVDTEQDLFLE